MNFAVAVRKYRTACGASKISTKKRWRRSGNEIPIGTDCSTTMNSRGKSGARREDFEIANQIDGEIGRVVEALVCGTRNRSSNLLSRPKDWLYDTEWRED